METLCLVAGLAGSSLVPARLFPTKEQGIKFMDELCKAAIDEGDVVRKEWSNIRIHAPTSVGSGVEYAFINLGSDHFQEAMESLFTRYYGGCGECELVIVVDIPVGEKISDFDLD